MRWMRVRHTRRTFATTVLLLLLAPALQIGWYLFLRSAGMENGSPALILLTLFPGGSAWFLPFGYAFILVGRGRGASDAR